MKFITSVFLVASLIAISACGKRDAKIVGTYSLVGGVENCTLIDLKTIQLEPTNLLIKGGGNKDAISLLAAKAKESGSPLDEDAFLDSHLPMACLPLVIVEKL